MPQPLDNLCPLVFRLDLILPAISQPILQRLQRVRCALRALMMPISLSILLPFHLGRVIEIHGDIFVSNAYVSLHVLCHEAKMTQNANGHFESPKDFFDQSF